MTEFKYAWNEFGEERKKQERRMGIEPRRVGQAVLFWSEWDEYTVKVWDQHGVRWHDADYFTPDKDDAENTMRHMKGGTDEEA